MDRTSPRGFHLPRQNKHLYNLTQISSLDRHQLGARSTRPHSLSPVLSPMLSPDSSYIQYPSSGPKHRPTLVLKTSPNEKTPKLPQLNR